MGYYKLMEMSLKHRLEYRDVISSACRNECIPDYNFYLGTYVVAPSYKYLENNNIYECLRDAITWFESLPQIGVPVNPNNYVLCIGFTLRNVIFGECAVIIGYEMVYNDNLSLGSRDIVFIPKSIANCWDRHMQKRSQLRYGVTRRSGRYPWLENSFDGSVDHDIQHDGDFLAGMKKTINAIYGRRKDINLNIKKVIFNDPATIVLWEDGTKTVVKTQADDIFDTEKGLAMAIVKKALGNEGNYYDKIKKWLPEEDKEDGGGFGFSQSMRAELATAVERNNSVHTPTTVDPIVVCEKCSGLMRHLGKIRGEGDLYECCTPKCKNVVHIKGGTRTTLRKVDEEDK